MPLTVHAQENSYEFDGPHENTVGLANASGVYVISTYNPSTGFHEVVDAGESEDVRKRIENHDRKESWSQHMAQGLYASAHYCDEVMRMAIEKNIRLAHNPPCGDR